MGRHSRRPQSCPRHASWRSRPAGLALALLFGSLTIPFPAAAETRLAQPLCGAGRDAAVEWPDSASLLSAAETTEGRLAVLREAPETSLDAVIAEPEPRSQGQPPGPAAIAAYCAAAGEAMRLASAGSQLQALTFLFTAFRAARSVNDPALAELSAFRLALVGIGGAGLGGVRGAGPAAADARGDAAATERGEDMCDRLSRIDPARLPGELVAELALACATASASAGGRARLAALADLRLARLYLAAATAPGRDRAALVQAARDTALAGLPLAAKLASPAERAELVFRLASFAVDHGAADGPALASATVLLREAAGEDGEAAGLGDALAARIFLAATDRASARRAIEQAILAESRRRLPSRLPAHFLLLARAEPERALQHVEAGYAALEAVRPLLPRLDPLTDESTFSLAMRDVFAAAAEAQLAAAEGAAAPARIRRAQEIVEAYRQAELQSAFGSGCVPPREPLRLAQLRAGEIVLYPLLLPDRIELLYVARGADGAEAPRFRRLPPNRSANRASVTRLVDEIVVALSGGGGDEAWRPAARRLYALLIAPVAERFGPDSMLAIVPDGVLRALPFAALIAPDGHFLIEQTRISLLPALEYSEPDGARRGPGLSVVAASLDKTMDLPAGRFPALAGTRREAEIAAGHASKGAVLPEFTRQELVRALDGRRVDVLHLATHAAFNGRSDRAFIVANGETIRLAELRDIVGRSRVRGTPLDLIVLSACETAVGDDEVSMGLSGAVVQAGARSVIGSLWQVSDLGTTGLMDEFYRRYAAGEPRSAALRDAQLALIRAGGEGADPSVWAAFTLLGAWR